MGRFVLDTSVAMSWCFADETSPCGERALDELTRFEALVPAIWPLEVANVLLMAERRGRMDEAGSRQFTRLLGALPIFVVGQTADILFGDVIDCARRMGLSSYDASFLELALRRELPLATQDRRLTAAAQKLGVPLF